MSSRSPSQLWRPGTGIRFAPKWLSGRPSLDNDNSSRTAGSPRSVNTHDTSAIFCRQGSSPMHETSPESPKTTIESPTARETAIQQMRSTPLRTSSSQLPDGIFLASGQVPQTSLEYKLSRTRFQEARKSAPDTPSSFWSHTLYERTNEDGSAENVKVHYCTSKHTMENVCKRYFENEPVLGFDMEWMSYANRNSGPRQNVSLIQIASPSRIALFHIALFPKDDFVAPTFQRLMEDAKVSKVGVNILADATRLRKVLDVQMAGVFEVSHLYNLVRYCKARLLGPVPKSAVSMSKQVKDCLGLPIYKAESVRAGDWMQPLSSRQLQYAASDAYAGLQLYHVLEQHRLQLDPQPPRPEFAELRRPITRPLLEQSDSLLEEDFIDESITDEDMMALDEAMTIHDLQSHPSTSVGKPSLPQSRDSRLSAADAAVDKFKALVPKRLARTSALRAYYVWHNNQDLTPASVASLLRDPPLQTNTVVTYILDVVTSEKLPYSKSRMASEVLSLVHPTAVMGRYNTLAQNCDYSPTT